MCKIKLKSIFAIKGLNKNGAYAWISSRFRVLSYEAKTIKYDFAIKICYSQI